MEAKRKKVLSILFYLIVILLLVTAGVLLIPEYHRNQKKKAELAELNQRKADRTAVRNRLAREVDELENSPHAIEKVAREKFGLCRPGETVMRYDSR